jgi:uncharacterized protein YciI
MRAALFLALIATLAACAHAPPPSRDDAALAQRLGADERGMRAYVLVMLRTGAYTPQSDEERDRLFEGHFANISRRAEEGTLVVAGPMGANDNQYRGILIFSVATIAEAQALVATDPTVAVGVFAPEYYEWYGSAALMEVPEIHHRLEP